MIQVLGGKQDPLAFAKMAGGGNDFVLIDDREGRVTAAPELTRRICTRRLSVGADGLILIHDSTRASFAIRYYNADGSLGEFCGNGTRCAARFAQVSGIAGPAMTIETDAGLVSAEVAEDGRVSISLPPPRAFRAERPLLAGSTAVSGSSITVGVPHYVLFLEGELWEQPIEPLGRFIRNHPDMQPAGTNVNFVVVRDGRSLEVRTYERGVEAETLSCGSGVVASVAVGTLLGKVRPPVSVLTRSGITLEVAMTSEGGELRDIRLTGDARLIYRAALTPDTVEGFDPDFLRHPSGAELKASSQ
ncbi:MAG TPA: diaminopimelate epimerase [Thermoanaerobaculia bacterium]|nr:diaminopimelate epimerase [Thermoanaerobaculia bacterium]